MGRRREDNVLHPVPKNLRWLEVEVRMHVVMTGRDGLKKRSIIPIGRGRSNSVLCVAPFLAVLATALFTING